MKEVFKRFPMLWGLVSVFLLLAVVAKSTPDRCVRPEQLWHHGAALLYRK
jgi:hypothetical protein